MNFQVGCIWFDELHDSFWNPKTFVRESGLQQLDWGHLCPEKAPETSGTLGERCGSIVPSASGIGGFKMIKNHGDQEIIAATAQVMSADNSKNPLAIKRRNGKSLEIPYEWSLSGKMIDKWIMLVAD